MKQGDIYLVNFGKKYNSEIGKIGPAVIVQNNYLTGVTHIKKFYHFLWNPKLVSVKRA